MGLAGAPWAHWPLGGGLPSGGAPSSGGAVCPAGAVPPGGCGGHRAALAGGGGASAAAWLGHRGALAPPSLDVATVPPSQARGANAAAFLAAAPACGRLSRCGRPRRAAGAAAACFLRGPEEHGGDTAGGEAGASPAPAAHSGGIRELLPGIADEDVRALSLAAHARARAREDAHAVQSSTMAAIRSAVKARADASRVAALAAKAELLQKRALAVQAKEEDAFLGLIEPVERATRAQIEALPPPQPPLYLPPMAHVAPRFRELSFS